MPRSWRPGQAELQIDDEEDKSIWGRAVPLSRRALEILSEHAPQAGPIWGAYRALEAIKSAAVAPLRFGAADKIRRQSDIPVLFVHRYRIAPDTIWAVLFLECDHPPMRDAYLEHARRLPHGVLYTDFIKRSRPRRSRMIDEIAEQFALLEAAK